MRPSCGRAEQQLAAWSAARGAAPRASAAVSATCSITSPAQTTSKLASSISQSPSPSISCTLSSGWRDARAAQRLLGDVDRQHLGAGARQLGGERALAAAEVEHPHAVASTPASRKRRRAARNRPARAPAGAPPRELRGSPATASRHESLEPAAGARARPPRATNVWRKREEGSAHSCREAVKASDSCSQRLCWRCEGRGASARPQSTAEVDEGRVGQPPRGRPRRRRPLRALPAARAARDGCRQRRGARDEPALQGLRARGADVFHTPWIDGAMLHSPCPMVVTVHDLQRPEAAQRAPAHEPAPAAAAARAAARGARDRPDRGGRRRRGRPPRPRARPGRRDPARPPTAAMYPRAGRRGRGARARHGLPERYLMWVGEPPAPRPGSHSPSSPPRPRELPLVLVGATAPVGARAARRDPHRRGRRRRARRALQRRARAGRLLRAGQGFGLPAVEALACGTPVAAADGPALREVLGDRATFVAPGRHGRADRRRPARERPAPPPPPWSWEDAARATWQVYERRRRRPAAAAPGASPRPLRPQPRRRLELADARAAARPRRAARRGAQ